MSDPNNNPIKEEKSSENSPSPKAEIKSEKKVESFEQEDWEKCPHCGVQYQKSKKPLYCSNCTKILVEIPNPPKEAKMKDRSEIFCPRCHFASKLNINPLFCMNCGYRFPRDVMGNILYDEEGYVFPDTVQTNPSQSTSTIPNHSQQQYSSAQFTSQSDISNIDLQRMYNYPIKKPKTWAMGPGFGVPILAFVIQFIILFGMIIVNEILNVLGISLPSITSNLTTFIESALSLFFAIIPVLWVQRYYTQKLTMKERLKELGLDLEKYSPLETGREILLGIVLGVVGVIVVIGLQYLSYELIESVYGINPDLLFNSSAEAQFGLSIPTDWGALLLIVLIMIIFVGFPEEIMFRGFVQRCFEAKLKKSAATLLTAIYFSFFHIFIYLLSPPLFLFLFIPYLGISLILGLVRNWRNDLLACAVLHIVYNSVQTIILFFIFM